MGWQKSSRCTEVTHRYKLPVLVLGVLNTIILLKQEMDLHSAMSRKYGVVNINHPANIPARFNFNICIQSVTNCFRSHILAAGH